MAHPQFKDAVDFPFTPKTTDTGDATQTGTIIPHHKVEVGAGGEASETNPLPVNTIRAGAWTNVSGTIATGGMSQPVCAANAARRFIHFQNVSVEDLWIDFAVDAVAAQPSIKVPAGESFRMDGSFVNGDALNVIGATTGSAFVCKEA